VHIVILNETLPSELDGVPTLLCYTPVCGDTPVESRDKGERVTLWTAGNLLVFIEAVLDEFCA
jgi:hypothetical protein